MTATIHHGDCLDILRQMPDNSVHAIVTDPPYGMGFVGKGWDELPPGKEWADECLRVIKPGGHLLAFGSTRTWHRLAVAVEDAGFEIRDSILWVHSEGFPKSRNLKGEWQGWGTALKPAAEPVIMARKPAQGSISNNMQMHGTGAINADACRVATTENLLRKATAGGSFRFNGFSTVGELKAAALVGGKCPNGRDAQKTYQNYLHTRDKIFGSTSGRWPSNVILDEAAAYEIEQQSEGASRFFYVAKAPKRERPVVDGVSHPTTKPLTLMRYLVRMVTPPGGTVLDPFAGSGTTIEAAMLEGFQVIGIEREAEYLPLIRHRIERATEQLKTEQQQQAEAPDQGAFPLEDIA